MPLLIFDGWYIQTVRWGPWKLQLSLEAGKLRLDHWIKTLEAGALTGVFGASPGTGSKNP
ncbi:MAG: hypothetical protein SGI92_19210 [Bryobacteraceae bacterium]|nr:hypothetical protein [Bryobacteraceae bacterium]